jgi:PmbA protein
VAEIIRGMDRGVIIDLLMGAWSGNAFGGVVSGNIMLGFVVENGEITGRLKNAMISLNAFSAFEKDILEISSDRLDYGSAFFPHILLDGASIVVKAD